jgi:hypothetical protein
VALVAVLVGYPLSFGPACWISSRANAGETGVSIVYRPVAWGMPRIEFVGAAVDWYSRVIAAPGWYWSPASDALEWR